MARRGPGATRDPRRRYDHRRDDHASWTKAWTPAPSCWQREVPIAATDDAGSLGERLAEPRGAAAWSRPLRSLRDGTAEVVPQDAAAALTAPKLTPEERDLDWTVDAQAAVDRRVRALSPAPGATTTFREAPVKVAEGRGDRTVGCRVHVDPRARPTAHGPGRDARWSAPRRDCYPAPRSRARRARPACPAELGARRPVRTGASAYGGP